MNSAILLVFIIVFIYLLYHPFKITEGIIGNKKVSIKKKLTAMPGKSLGPYKDDKVTKLVMRKNIREPFTAPNASDYNEFMINTGLEQSVLESHQAFAKDVNTTTSTASAATEMSHDDSIVPKWGLRRATPRVYISENAREVPSSTNEQIYSNDRSSGCYGLF